ncbi:MAG: hypothetical protein J6N70_12505 [Oribacterium sp.]|nr:hypothetical protein [Oribacterium sp.]
MKAFKYIVNGAFAGSILFSLIREIQSLNDGNREQVYFYWGLTLFLILMHKWVMEERE